MWNFLMGLAGPIAVKALTALGIGIVTYVGLEAAFDAAENAVRAQFGQLGAQLVSLISLAGIGEGIGIVLAALAMRITLTTVSKMGRVAT